MRRKIYVLQPAAGRRMQFFHLIFMGPGHRTLAFSPLLYIFFLSPFPRPLPPVSYHDDESIPRAYLSIEMSIASNANQPSEPHTLNCLVSADALAEVGQKILVLSQHFAWLPGEFLLFLPNVFCQSRHGIIGRHSIRELASLIIWTLPPSTGTL